MNSDGLLRAESRLSNSPKWTEKTKPPVVLSSRSALTRLVV